MGTGFRLRAASRYTMLLVKRSCVSSSAPLRSVRVEGTVSAVLGMSASCRLGMQAKASGESGDSCKGKKPVERLERGGMLPSCWLTMQARAFRESLQGTSTWRCCGVPG